MRFKRNFPRRFDSTTGGEGSTSIEGFAGPTENDFFLPRDGLLPGCRHLHGVGRAVASLLPCLSGAFKEICVAPRLLIEDHMVKTKIDL